MFYQPQYSFSADGVKFEHDIDYNFPAHLHNSFEFIIVTDGEMFVNVGKNNYCLHAGDSMLIFPNQVHDFVTPKHSEHYLCIFSSQLVQAYSRYTLGKVPLNNLFKMDEYISKKIFDRKDDLSIFELKGLLYSVCGVFDENAEYKAREESKDELLAKIFNFVDCNYNKKCSLSELAEATSYHYVYLSKYFKTSTGVAFTDYVNRYRVKEACYLLRNNVKHTILQVALECGFDSLRTFNRNFKRVVGMTPSEYQNNFCLAIDESKKKRRQALENK